MAASTRGDEPPPTPECCMCGDWGLPDELFRCSNCHFRSQHRYCSNLYPKADSYRYCNWCLKDDRVRALVPSPCVGNSNITDGVGDVRPLRGEFPLSLISNPIKKQRSPERPPKLSAVQRTRSEDMSSVVKSKQVFRGKVRRYKLLEEVSS